ncbi:MAG: hypothetical protein IKP99_02525 [Bacteroidales bacterium]|nr:hypothetical protein [Bacteroidales bacterium]
MNKIRLTSKQIEQFQNTVLKQGEKLYREMPWREDTNPYNVLLSEIMLQQTQVSRVLLKYEEFKSAFPTLQALAEADFQEVLSHWSGLGYNRRARFLHETAKMLVAQKSFPDDADSLQKCPGIGENTAAAIVVYAFNKPLTFLETNVRTVLIYSFFQEADEKIDEHVLKDLAEQTLYVKNPRKWYWALMDYGTYLKKTEGNFNRKSTKHTIQSKFEGSFRQKRAATLRCLLKNGPMTIDELAETQRIGESLMVEIVETLKKDSLVTEVNNRIIIQ